MSAADETREPARLTVDCRFAVGGLRLAVQFALREPWTALFAPSGEGKTTVLRLIAGLERPDAGRIAAAEPGEPARQVVLCDRATRTFVPPHRRRIRLVSQQPALFPHMSVVRNVTFAMPRGTARGPAQQEEVTRLLTLCRVEALRDRMPAQLSGGEAQRVALARSLAASEGCRLLLLDEPFSGLELDLRAALIADLRAWTLARGLPVLMVTHDVGEVLWSGAEVIRLRDGRVKAQGPAAEVLKPEVESLRAQLAPPP